jgi:hypothetical protein
MIRIRLLATLCSAKLRGEAGETISVPADQAAALVAARAAERIDEREERIQLLESAVEIEREFLAPPPGPHDDDWTPGPEFPR